MYSFEDGLRTDAARAAPRTGFGEAGGEDALPYIWADVIATMAVWPAGLAAAALIFSEAASPYYQQKPAQQ